jgi:superfamily II DNA or RNA helicase
MVDRETGGRVSGGILADGMGMGKTFQMIGLVAANPLPHTLIVVPCSLIDQWCDAFYRFTGHRPLRYHGASKHRISATEFATSPVVIASYGTLVTRTDKTTGLPIEPRHPNRILAGAWDRVIYDEAHHLRNRGSKVRRGAATLDTTFTWLATGTPIQNGASDIHSLLGLIERVSGGRPGSPEELFASNALRRTADMSSPESPVFQGAVVESTAIVPWGEEHLAAESLHIDCSRLMTLPDQVFMSDTVTLIELMAKQAMGRMLPPYFAGMIVDFLRETPERTERARAALDAAGMVGETELDMAAAADDPADDPSDDPSDHTFARFMRMRLACTAGSGSTEAVCTTIKNRMNNGSGKIVFFNYLAERDAIHARCTASGAKVFVVRGDVSGRDRYRTITSAKMSATKGDAPVLLVHMITGSEGLNLQEFNEVFFASSNWNPAMENQAIARCARMGQKKDVSVFRFHRDGFGGVSAPRCSMDTYMANRRNIKRQVIHRFDSIHAGGDGEIVTGAIVTE